MAESTQHSPYESNSYPTVQAGNANTGEGNTIPHHAAVESAEDAEKAGRHAVGILVGTQA
jgi:pyruvate kinase